MLWRIKNSWVKNKKICSIPDYCFIPRKQLPFNKIRQVSWLVLLQCLPVRRLADSGAGIAKFEWTLQLRDSSRFTRDSLLNPFTGYLILNFMNERECKSSKLKHSTAIISKINGIFHLHSLHKIPISDDCFRKGFKISL